MGTCNLTDGEYLYAEGLSHYLLEHGNIILEGLRLWFPEFVGKVDTLVNKYLLGGGGFWWDEDCFGEFHIIEEDPIRLGEGVAASKSIHSRELAVGEREFIDSNTTLSIIYRENNRQEIKKMLERVNDHDVERCNIL